MNKRATFPQTWTPTHERDCSLQMLERPENMKSQRRVASAAANAEDAALWRWFSELMEDRRIRWLHADDSWLVTVDHKHVATSRSFDDAIRTAQYEST
ncbi:hypothetical protein [Paraburkholderia sp. HP33-1]|uniref:hypothetical protein n=1 Tax=Paraburkholderia sp. HP33-1 TaxID=2883243 RepID=UPI001F3F704E|nr:hypothetical protein [Paraburkholderia sp. HP33-1]